MQIIFVTRSLLRFGTTKIPGKSSGKPGYAVGPWASRSAWKVVPASSEFEAAEIPVSPRVRSWRLFLDGFFLNSQSTVAERAVLL
jgi:hypothetical protein